MIKLDIGSLGKIKKIKVKCCNSCLRNKRYLKLIDFQLIEMLCDCGNSYIWYNYNNDSIQSFRLKYKYSIECYRDDVVSFKTDKFVYSTSDEKLIDLFIKEYIVKNKFLKLFEKLKNLKYLE